MSVEMERGARARQLLKDEMLQEALREVRYAAHRIFEDAKTPDQLRRASDLLESANYFERFLRSVAELGEAEIAKREREVARGKRVPASPLLAGMTWRANGIGR